MRDYGTDYRRSESQFKLSAKLVRDGRMKKLTSARGPVARSAAMSVARLWRCQGKRDGARELLALDELNV
jgi:hypothetical protein